MKRIKRLFKVIILTAVVITIAVLICHIEPKESLEAPISTIYGSEIDQNGFNITTLSQRNGERVFDISIHKTGITALDIEVAKVYQGALENFFGKNAYKLELSSTAVIFDEILSLTMLTAEDGKTSTYTVVYDMEKGAFVTLEGLIGSPDRVLAELLPSVGGAAVEGVADLQSYIQMEQRMGGIPFTFTEQGISIVLKQGGERKVVISHEILEPYVKYRISVKDGTIIWEGQSAETPEYKYKVALTFDDGPSPETTERLLDGLFERGVKATFFVLGVNVDRYPHIVTRISNEGHQVGSHSYGHPRLTDMTNEDIIAEMEQVAYAIELATGEPPSSVRLPYGAGNHRVRSLMTDPIIAWSVDERDWELRNAELIYQNTIETVEDGDIILMHDIHEEAVDAALMIIDDLTKKGYEFVTVEELATSYGVELEVGRTYYKILPQKIN